MKHISKILAVAMLLAIVCNTAAAAGTWNRRSDLPDNATLNGGCWEFSISENDEFSVDNVYTTIAAKNSNGWVWLPTGGSYKGFNTVHVYFKARKLSNGEEYVTVENSSELTAYADSATAANGGKIYVFNRNVIISCDTMPENAYADGESEAAVTKGQAIVSGMRVYVADFEKPEDLFANPQTAHNLEELNNIAILTKLSDTEYRGPLTQAWSLDIEAIRAFVVIKSESDTAITTPKVLAKGKEVYVVIKTESEEIGVEVEDISLNDILDGKIIGVSAISNGDSIWFTVENMSSTDYGMLSTDVFIRSVTVPSKYDSQGALLSNSRILAARAVDILNKQVGTMADLEEIAQVSLTGKHSKADPELTTPSDGKKLGYNVEAFGNWIVNTTNGAEVLYDGDDPVPQGTPIPAGAKFFVRVKASTTGGDGNSGNNDTQGVGSSSSGGGCNDGFGVYALALAAAIIFARKNHNK